MDYITDNVITYKIYDDLIYKTHIYIVNNMYNYEEYINHIYDNDNDTLTSLQYFNIMSFLDEIE